MIIFVPADSWCGDLTPKQILRRADEARGNLDGVEWKVQIASVERGRKKKRVLRVKARGYDFLGVFLSPPKVKGQKILMIDHNMWFVRPQLAKPVPITPRQKLIGAANYGDVAATNYSDDYEVKSLSDEMFNGEQCYLFDLKAITKKATYDRIKYWISRKRLVGLKAEYYTVSGKMLKSALFESTHQIEVGDEIRPFISKMFIRDALVSENVTTLTFSKPKFVKVSDATFDLNLLMLR